MLYRNEQKTQSYAQIKAGVNQNNLHPFKFLISHWSRMCIQIIRAYCQYTYREKKKANIGFL